MINKLEDLIIYKQHVDFLIYIDMLLEKYPKKERYVLVTNIANENYKIIRLIISAYKTSNKEIKKKYLFEIDTCLKVMKFYARMSFRKKYINIKNYNAWSNRLFNLGNLLGGWIKNA